MVASSVVSTILILNYHHRNADSHEMSEWVISTDWYQSAWRNYKRYDLIVLLITVRTRKRYAMRYYNELFYISFKNITSHSKFFT